MTSSAFSQNSNEDSLTCIPNSQLRIAAKLIDKGRIDSMELALRKRHITYQEELIKALDKRVEVLNQTISLHNRIEQTYEKDKRSFLDQIAVVNQQVVVLEKDLKKQKRKTFFTGLAGVIATGLTLYFTTK